VNQTPIPAAESRNPDHAPTLVDLHVRPVLNEVGRHDVELLAVQARDRGIDGLAVVGCDEGVDLGDTAEVCAATGVHLFAGVELETDAGRLLCYPRTVDGWFLDARWREIEKTNGAGPARYPSGEIVRVFSERGGVVVAAGDAATEQLPEPQPIAIVPGVAAVAVAVPGGGSGFDERALHAAYTARVACIGGSGAVPGDDRFGAVATVFALPPTSQEALVDGLRSGRVWPVEIGARWVPQPARAPEPVEPAAATASESHGPDRAAERPSQRRRDSSNGRESFNGRDSQRQDGGRRGQGPQGQPAKPSWRYDSYERPGDNRGNRLNRDELLRRMPMAAPDDSQPRHDPIAVFYGVERRQLRLASLRDDELDRINGNRARGPDPNVMAMPSFDELRPDRHNLQALLGRFEDEEDDLEDSVSLRFALAHYNQTLGQVSVQHLPGGHRSGGHRNHRRRRH
jgi:hypothetical protein